jgi:alkylhydroperoxidase/carboxymuconolactone decarboxylase family protein YurZ
MPRIRWIEDSEAQGETAALYARMKAEHPLGMVPAIMRTMSLRPDFLELIRDAGNRLHFRDGALSRAQHEMIASYVSALNRCRY